MLGATPAPNGSAAGPAPRRAKSDHRGVLLLNLGTPDAPEPAAVRRYLAEFLSDPEVIRLPRAMRWFNRPLGHLIARFRGSASAALYRNIWTDRGSPLKVITEEQVEALQQALPNGWRVFYAMRYGTPAVAEVLAEIVEAGIDELVVVPMYPQYSGPTTGTAMSDLYAALHDLGQHLDVTVRNSWHDDAGYVDAQARLLHAAATEHGLDPTNTHLVFSAHSMPESYVRDGDPYQAQILHTVELVARRLGWPKDHYSVTYQSRLGPVPWLEPSTDGRLAELAEAGEDQVLVCPLSFTADCLESLEEIGIQSRELFAEAGGTLHLCPALNTYPPFIKALTQLVLRGHKPVNDRGRPVEPLIEPAPAPNRTDVGLDSLVMVGISLPGRLGPGGGPVLAHVTPAQFQAVKRPHEEITEVLREVHEAGGFHECWLWNTCSRFELYGWLSDEPASSAADQSTARALSRLLGARAEHIPVNILRGADAWHHLLRTAAGLNSGLPGDVEVAAQLAVGQRVAARCGTTGPLTERLLGDIAALQDDLRERTSWGDVRPAYCPVTTERVSVQRNVDWSTARCVIIGGSATARSILNALRERFAVPTRHITAVYRTHCRGTQIKRLREAIGDGTRLRVETYGDRRVSEAIAEADVVFMSLDHRVPVLRAGDLPANRDYQSRPLLVLDFNTFGSTRGLEKIEGVHLHPVEALDREVAEYAAELVGRADFTAAAVEADAWIVGRLPEVAETAVTADDEGPVRDPQRR